MIDEYQEMEHFRTRGRFYEENRFLQKHISCYQRSWHATMNLLEEAFEAVLLIQRSLNDCDAEMHVAKKEWLALWNVYVETTEGLEYPLPEWT
jgi:hypothetical protein